MLPVLFLNLAKSFQTNQRNDNIFQFTYYNHDRRFNASNFHPIFLEIIKVLQKNVLFTYLQFSIKIILVSLAENIIFSKK